MPLLPLSVGLVTSLGSDAERDVLETLTASSIGFHVRCFDVRVQGDQAPATVASAIAALDGRVDVIVLARGGGGATDLAAFDSERVARAICSAAVPVLTGIGHERDVSVADEVANEHHKTPTAVAQALVARIAHVHGRVESAWDAIGDRARRHIDAEHDRAQRLAGSVESAARTATAGQQHRLERLSDRLERAADHGLLAQRHRLDEVADRLTRTAPRVVREADDRRGRIGSTIARTATARLRTADETQRGRRAQVRRVAAARMRDADRRVDAAATKLALLDPATTLARGWSITRRADGSVVRSVDDVDPGDELVTTVADGEIQSRTPD